MACSVCDGTLKVCTICNQSSTDCVCDDEDIRDYIEEEDLDSEDFQRWKDCEECDE